MIRLEEFTECGSHQKGHFLLSSGLHSGDYMQCALFLARPERAERAGRLLAKALTDAGINPDVIVAPAMGGLIIGHEVARAMGRPSIFTERVEQEMVLRRGFAVAEKQSIVVIEDVVTTGKSTREVVAVLQAQGARVLAVGSIVNRSEKPNPFGDLPFRSLLSLDFPTWMPEECPLCADQTPIAKPGSRPVV
ncbi:MAG: orotate phosphoribosyltransferase [Thermoanaerobaculales bacterium]|nr:orotate phosphoribosyltransferase [Thermoanaerobaculales bacterium]